MPNSCNTTGLCVTTLTCYLWTITTIIITRLRSGLCSSSTRFTTRPPCSIGIWTTGRTCLCIATRAYISCELPFGNSTCSTTTFNNRFCIIFRIVASPTTYTTRSSLICGIATIHSTTIRRSTYTTRVCINIPCSIFHFEIIWNFSKTGTSIVSVRSCLPSSTSIERVRNRMKSNGIGCSDYGKSNRITSGLCYR